MSIIVALDALGGEGGVNVTVPAAISSLKGNPNLFIILVGSENLLRDQLGENQDHPRLRIQNAEQFVEMDEPPSAALRFKKDSSMRIAIDLVNNNEAHACVSAGNTGALMATSKFVLKTLPGIDRPGICGVLPRAYGKVRMMDLGASLACPPSLLYQFGVMATIIVRYLDGIDQPSIGLLNVGIEDIKGNKDIKDASQLLQQSHLNYQGFVEGSDIFTGSVDIIICDGFSGNVALKTSEGLAQMLIEITKEGFEANFSSKLFGILSKPILGTIFQRIDHRRYNGAALLGLRGIVVKSHGGADSLAYENAIDIAYRAVESKVISHIETELQQPTLRQQKIN